MWVRRFAAAVVVSAAVLFVPIWRAIELAADPSGPKDCSPLAPGTVGDKPTALQVEQTAHLLWSQRGGAVNDASCLNRTQVHGVVTVRSADDVALALTFAQAHHLRVSVAGVRHSMGGHAFAPQAVVLDMTGFKRMSLDAGARVLTVESGATWHDIQRYLHPQFAVKAMQSTDIFTVGGSISVNAHGMDHRAGSVGRTVRAMRVMTPDGVVRRVSRVDDPRLFNLVVGGYGLFGVILDVDLDVTENVVYRSERRVIDYRQFVGTLNDEIIPDASYRLMYGHLSTSPASLLQEMLVYTYRTVDARNETVPPLAEVAQVKLRRFVFNLSKQGPMSMRLKWLAEKHIEPLHVQRPRCMATGAGASFEGHRALQTPSDQK